MGGGIRKLSISDMVQITPKWTQGILRNIHRLIFDLFIYGCNAVRKCRRYPSSWMDVGHFDLILSSWTGVGLDIVQAVGWQLKRTILNFFIKSKLFSSTHIGAVI